MGMSVSKMMNLIHKVLVKRGNLTAVSVFESNRRRVACQFPKIDVAFCSFGMASTKSRAAEMNSTSCLIYGIKYAKKIRLRQKI
ncbi:hypothetical protein DICVIV_08884 [Dictyocaulus viviparus]|uniref:Uncharacterized protein n=1 Tax=Dictyocaulus viviparus TaxID=29172 RepID=A0A0D8XMT8_DICVI|nr:hypothetical protein DICVIV_08884 [Dictyocaulus viviparus]